MNSPLLNSSADVWVDAARLGRPRAPHLARRLKTLPDRPPGAASQDRCPTLTEPRRNKRLLAQARIGPEVVPLPMVAYVFLTSANPLRATQEGLTGPGALLAVLGGERCVLGGGGESAAAQPGLQPALGRLATPLGAGSICGAWRVLGLNGPDFGGGPLGGGLWDVSIWI